MKNYLLFCIVILYTNVSITKAEELNFIKNVKISKTNEKITIDAFLTESVWQSKGFTGLIQQDPVQGVNPTQFSEMWVTYDDEAFYFAAKYYDSHPDSIIARLVRRDFIWGDPSDGCVLYLDPFGDKRNGYFFYVSAAGGIADGLIENDTKQPNDLTWDAVWEGKARIDEKGWYIEMKIPYSQIRFKDSEIQNWGINVERFISRNAETDMLAFTPRNEAGFTSRFPVLIGLNGIKTSKGFELLPYITGKAEYVGNDPSDPFNPGKKYEPGIGVDIKAGLGSSLMLNGTINPDFGQVELDPAVVNLTDVESAFEEKRPFFTEGVTVFQFGRGGINNNVNYAWSLPNIFYSRRIGRAPQGMLPNYDYADVPNGTHILGAAKITGKVFDDWRIGTIHAVTKREFADIELNKIRSDIELEPLTYYGVLRIQKDFNSRKQGFGILSTFTNRFFKDDRLQSFINKDALVVAADGWTNLTEDGTYVLSGWGALSRISGDKNRIIAVQQNAGHYFQRPDATHLNVDTNATSLTGFSGRLVLNKNRGAFVLNSAIGFVSPKFEINDLGFNSFSDLINAHIYTGYRFNTPTKYYQNAGFTLATYANYDFGGNITANSYNFGSYITLPDLYGANFNISYSPATYNARKTRGGPLTRNPISRAASFNAYSDNRLWWVISFGGLYRNGEDSKTIDFYTGFEFKVTPTLTLQFNPEIIAENYNAQWLTSYSDNTATETYKRRYVFANLKQNTVVAEVRADWIITSDLSLQVYLQPLIAAGKYDNFKVLKHPKSYNFMKYGEQGSSLIKTTFESGYSIYTLDADGEGPSNPKTIGDPNFNYISLRGSAVLRWEYLPGSTLYFVWTQSRENIESTGDFEMGHSFDTMMSIKPDNIFMIKISYWL